MSDIGNFNLGPKGLTAVKILEVDEYDVREEDGGLYREFSTNLAQRKVPGRKENAARQIGLTIGSADYPEGLDIDEDPIHPEMEALFEEGNRLKITLSIEVIE